MTERKSHSIFLPFVLIGLGIYLLTQQLGWPQFNLNWDMLFRIWPVWLIAGGLGIIVDQFNQPARLFFQAILGFVSVGFAVAVLLVGNQMTSLSYLSSNDGKSVKVEEITV